MANNTQPPGPRFIVRKGSVDWMVYDRELKRPAQLGKDGRFGERLTKEEAEQLKQKLMDDLVRQQGTRSVAQPKRPAKRPP
ncbi:hypothetical protein ACVW16_001243 [Bradyrhizobium sp. USDA 4474]